MMFSIDANYQAADAYHARLCAELVWFEKAVKAFPPTCECCEHAGFDGDQAYCSAMGEWVEGIECIDTDSFWPNPQWEAYQPSW